MTDGLTHKQYADMLLASTEAMFAGGKPLMSRILPEDGTAELSEHYPEGDVVNGPAGSRYFYHCHPPGERAEGEHGHFHLFFDRSAMPGGTVPLIAAPLAPRDEPRADVVHIAALAISDQGLPLQWFGTNRWVTDEWLYPAYAVIAMLDQFDLRGPNGDSLVNEWLTAMVGLAREEIAELLHSRDDVLREADMNGQVHGEDRAVEITSAAPISLERLLETA